ncbi:MAG: hypothetical protein IPG79_09175 [Saprospiraceae bacterium]|nr:hypothetical protein [Saprospiraceae bacterium]
MQPAGTTSSNFAIGFSKTANFKDKILYNGKTEGTITEYFSEKANSLSVDELDDFAAFPAYNTGAIFDFDGDKNYETDFAEEDLLVKKQQNINRRGSVNELSFTWAGDYKNKFNIGIGVGIPFVNFSEEKVYIESDPDDEIATFNRLKYIEDLSITGAGFNAKIGIQAKPFSWFRIGGAFHTPTVLHLRIPIQLLWSTLMITKQMSIREMMMIYPNCNLNIICLTPGRLSVVWVVCLIWDKYQDL